MNDDCARSDDDETPNPLTKVELWTLVGRNRINLERIQIVAFALQDMGYKLLADTLGDAADELSEFIDQTEILLEKTLGSDDLLTETGRAS